MSFIIVLNRLDVLINRVERLAQAVAAYAGVPIDELPPVIVVPPPEVVVSQLPNRYKIARIDLTVAHVDEPIGLRDLLKGVGALYASYMNIITVPGAFTFKLNSTDMDAIDAIVGFEQADFEITEIFITNAAAAVVPALMNIEYRVD